MRQPLAAALAVLLLALPFISPAQSRAQSRTPLAVRPGAVLFIDDHYIANSEGLTRTPHSPDRYGPPIVGLEHRPWQPWITVLFDPDTKKYRMWYNSHGPDPDHANYLAYLESDDGIHWPGPHRQLMPIPGFGASVIDEGPSFTPAAERFKLGYFRLVGDEKHGPPPRNAVKSGMCVATSPDGLAWQTYEGNPVLPFYWAAFKIEEEKLRPVDARLKEQLAELRAISTNDIIGIYRDPLLGGYSVTCKLMSRSHAEFGMSSRTATEGIRLVGQSHSVDFFHWAPDPPRRIMVPDAQDPGVFEFYSARAVPSDNFTLGMVKVLRDDVAASEGGDVEGIGVTTLAITYDGLNWTRLRDTFLDRNPDPAAWDRGHAWIDSVLNVGDQTYFYYGGYKGGHKVNRYTERLIGLARLRKDGYVSRDTAPGATGRLTTHPIAFAATGLHVNANVKGSLRVRLLDPDGRPINGYESAPTSGDSVRHDVQFQKPLSDLKGRPVSIEFTLTDARLYGFELR